MSSLYIFDGIIYDGPRCGAEAMTLQLYGVGDAYLFHKLKIWHQGADYQEHQGRYPTIFITFKGNKGSHSI
jgi:hypothetical protein